jgi:hypothetical protein
MIGLVGILVLAFGFIVQFAVAIAVPSWMAVGNFTLSLL